MSDTQKLDEYFYQGSTKPSHEKVSAEVKHTRYIHLAKLLLPGVAVVLVSLLLIIPKINRQIYDIKIDITRPKGGELEKLHVENTTFYLTDKNNRVNNFTADSIDETEPGSKLVKLINPEGIMPGSRDDWTNIKAPTAYYNQNDNTLEATDNVELFYSEGMTINTFDAVFNFKTGIGSSRSPLSGQGIFGDIKSAGFDIFNDTGTLIFVGPTDIKIREESFTSRKQ